MMTTDPIALAQKEFDETTAKINELNQLLKEKSKVLMKEMFASFFKKYETTVECIFWTQYTPYFNDGEACEFGVNDSHIIMKDRDEDEDEDFYYEGSRLYDQDYLNELLESLEKTLAWERNPIAEAKKYQADYIKRYNRDPFSNKDYYNRGKSEYDLMKEWKPSYYGNSSEIQTKIEIVEEFLQKYPTIKEDFKKIQTMISSIAEDLMKAMFGDHVRVVVTKDSIETEEYQHD